MNSVLSTQSPLPAARNPGHERNRARISSECAPHSTHAATPRAPRAQSAVHLSYNSPFSPVLTKVDDGLSSNPTAHRQLRGQTGGFATIGPRHAGDTPPEASYGRNSPPHLRVGTHLEHDHIGRDTLNTGHLRTPRAQSAIHLSYNSPFSPVLTKADYGLSNNPTAHSQLRGQTWGFCDHRPPTRRRHADRNLLWSQFPPHLRVGTHLEHDHIGRDTLNTEHLRTPRAQSPVHLSQNSPLSPVLTKVDDGLSSKPKLRPS